MLENVQVLNKIEGAWGKGLPNLFKLKKDIVWSHNERWERFDSWQLCTGQHCKFQYHPRWRCKIKMEYDLQKVREVIVGICNTVLYELESYPYLARSLRYAPSKIAALWHLVTLRDIPVRHAWECSSTEGDRRRLGIRFNQPLKANRVDILIPQWKVREICQLATLYWPTL